MQHLKADWQRIKCINSELRWYIHVSSFEILNIKKKFIYSEMLKSNHNVPIMIHVHVGYIPPPPYTFWMGYVLYPF